MPRGGRRPGSGPKPIRNPKIVRSFTLRMDTSMWLDTMPLGQRSNLVQQALDQYRQQEHKDG